MFCFQNNIKEAAMARTAKKFLNVKYTDRELAKRLGARWDPSVQRWYCPAGSPLATIFKWRAEAVENKSTVKHVAQNENFEFDLAG